MCEFVTLQQLVLNTLEGRSCVPCLYGVNVYMSKAKIPCSRGEGASSEMILG